MNYVIGQSRQELKSINRLACSSNPNYVAARNTYNTIMNKAAEFIKVNAPVEELIISKYNYNTGTAKIYSDDDLTYCLTIRYIPRAKTVLSVTNRTLYSFKISSEFVYILRSEGWKYSSSNGDGLYYYLEVSDDG